MNASAIILLSFTALAVPIYLDLRGICTGKSTYLVAVGFLIGLSVGVAV